VLSDKDRTAILSGIRTLPPHPEVKDSLERLKQAGLRLAALTNSASEVAHAQLNHAGLAPYFEQILSVEMAGKFKPARETYLKAAERLGVAPSDMRMVAAHNWDTTGAMRAGCAAAFVARPGMVLGPTDETPDIIGVDVMEVAGRIIEKVSHAS
jgi:2-haloacid dehalogenase